MVIGCETAKALLDRFYDKELNGKKLKQMSEHLSRCENCSNELKKREQLGLLLRSHYERATASEDLSHLWGRVSDAIETAPAPERESIRDRLVRIFAVPRPAWAVVTAMAFLIILALAYLPGDQAPTLLANDCVIDTVETDEDATVMVYEVGDTGMKVIWIMEESGETTSQTGVAS
jgi:hypothetical protein